MFRRSCFNRCCWKCNCNREYRNCCYRTYENREKQDFDITMDQLKIMQLQGVPVVDVRSPQEYNEGHINGAIVIPDYEIYRKINRVIANKNSKFIVYCDTGIRSLNTLKRLQKMGYTEVYNLYKGMENY